MFAQERTKLHNIQVAHHIGEMSPKERNSIREYLSKSVLPYFTQVRYYLQQAEAEQRAEDTAKKFGLDLGKLRATVRKDWRAVSPSVLKELKWRMSCRPFSAPAVDYGTDGGYATLDEIHSREQSAKPSHYSSTVVLRNVMYHV